METEIISSVSEEQLKPIDTEQSSIEILQSFLVKDRLNPSQDYSRLLSYAQSRGRLLNINKPINLFLRYESMVETPNGSSLEKIRYNPISDDIYEGDWSWTSRAFHSYERGTFFDFPAQPRGQQAGDVLEGYQATDSIIDFGYTCEHELRHDIQQQRLDSREISYDALRLAKDHIMIQLVSRFAGGEYFYINAHDDLFLEIDANAQASEFMEKVILSRNGLAERIVNPKDPAEHRRSVVYLLSRRIEEGVASHKDSHKLSLGENSIGISPKEYSGSAEEIVSDFCDDVLKKYPYLIKEYPALALEYNEDGSRRSLSNIKNFLWGAKNNGYIYISGQKIDFKQLDIIYHRLRKHSRKLQDEKPGSTFSK